MNGEVTETAPRSPVSMKLIIGLALIAFGVLITADQFEVLEAEPYLDWWPVVLIIAGVVKLIERGSRGLALFLLIAGTSLLIYNLGIVAFNIFDLWPLLLIIGGVAMATQAFRRPAVPDTTEQSTNSINASAVFSTRHLTSQSSNFTGGSVFAFMSGCEIDLTRADISRPPAVIDATAIWAAIEIIVPDSWEVIGEVTPVMGGFDMKSGSSDDAKRKLVVRGVALMGAIEVKTRSTP